MSETEDAIERVKKFYLLDYKENVHPIWEKTVNSQKMIVVGFYNPDISADAPIAYILVYEEDRLKHFVLQVQIPAGILYIENFQELKPHCKITEIETHSLELQFYFHITRAFIDSCYLFVCPSDKGDVRWEKYPYPRVAVKYVIPSIADSLSRAVLCARKLDRKDFGSLVDDLGERLRMYIIRKYPNILSLTPKLPLAEEEKEIQSLLMTVWVKHGRILLMQKDEIDVEKQNEAIVKAYAVWASALLDVYTHTDPKDIVIGGLKE